MTNVVDLQQERALRRPAIYASLDEALADAQRGLHAMSDLTQSALLLDSEEVLDLTTRVSRIVSACRSFVYLTQDPPTTPTAKDQP